MASIRARIAQIFDRPDFLQAVSDHPRAVERAVEGSRFETVFKRKLGELDEKSHGRQGLPGDWRNHFSPRVRRAFHERAGELLITAGYEKDATWIDTP